MPEKLEVIAEASADMESAIQECTANNRLVPLAETMRREYTGFECRTTNSPGAIRVVDADVTNEE